MYYISRVENEIRSNKVLYYRFIKLLGIAHRFCLKSYVFSSNL